jgi:hypothetical protein
VATCNNGAIEREPFSPWWRPLIRADRRALVALSVLPFVIFTIAALANHPALEGDNLIQNFPLRVLSGQQLRSGHLPLFNPLVNAGAPLLGGLNAGSLYPVTVAYAYLPPMVAWVITIASCYSIAGLGVFALLRTERINTMPALLGGISFAYLGAMANQAVHIAVIQGFAFLPWGLLITITMARTIEQWRDQPLRLLLRHCLPWGLMLAFLWGLIFLTGEPRAIAEFELLLLIAVPALLFFRSSAWLSTWKGRVVFLGVQGVGLFMGACLGLVQLLPGWAFIGLSQRSVITYQFFGSGSLAVRWSPLLLLPDLFGGNGSFGQPSYFTSYNLPEVTGYVGLIGAMATCGFLTHLTRRGWKGHDRDFMIYIALGAVGLIATWGNFTPLGHVFKAIPMFGSTRLQSRNVILVDLAVAVLLGWWINQLATKRQEERSVSGRAKWITLLPALFVAGGAIALLTNGRAIVDRITDIDASGIAVEQMVVSNLFHLLFALSAVVAVLVFAKRPSLRPLVTLFLIDVLAFLALSGTGWFGNGQPTMPSAERAASVLKTSGRVALVDQFNAHERLYNQLGSPNLNVFTKQPSIQGYGSLISTIYGTNTGTHPRSQLDPCQLAKGRFAQLRLGAIALPATQLTDDLRLRQPEIPRCLPVAPVTQTTRYFGRELSIRSIALIGLDPNTPVTSGPATVQLLDLHGKTIGTPLEIPALPVATISVPASTGKAAGFVIHAPNRITLTREFVRARDTGATYGLETPFQEAMAKAPWQLSTVIDDVAVFTANNIVAEFSLERPDGGAQLSSPKVASWGDGWVTVATKQRVGVVRSMAYLPGWQVTARNLDTGALTQLPVLRHGLVQSVVVPPGHYELHFHYHAPYIRLSLIITVSAWMLLGLCTLWLIRLRRQAARRGE